MSDAALSVPEDDLLATSAAGPAAVRGGVLRVGGYLLGVALSVFSAALLFRHLGVKDGGRYVTVLSLVALFGGLTEAGLASIAVRELSSTARADRGALMRNMIGLRFALSFIAVIGALVFSVAVGYESVMVAGAALAGTGMLIQNVQMTWGAELQSELRFGAVAALDLLRQVVQVSGIVALALAGAALLPFFALTIPAALAAAIATGVLVRRRIPLLPQYEREVWVRLLRDVAPYAAATAVAAVYLRVALIILSLVSTDTQTGYFSASFRVVEVLFGVPVLAVGVAFPIFARAAAGDLERLRYAVRRVAEVSAILASLVVVGIFVGAPFVIRVVAGPDFAPAASVLQIECIGLLGSFLAAVWGYALLSLKRHRTILYLALGPLIVSATLTFALAPSHGARGAALATAIGEAVYATAGAILVTRALGGLHVAVVARALLVAVPCGAFALIGGVPSLVLALAAGAAYLLLLWLVGGLPRDLIADLRTR